MIAVKMLKTIVEPRGSPANWIRVSREGYGKPGEAREMLDGDEDYINAGLLVVKETPPRREIAAVPFKAGNIVMLSEGSARKYVERGWAELVDVRERK